LLIASFPEHSILHNEHLSISAVQQYTAETNLQIVSRKATAPFQTTEKFCLLQRFAEKTWIDQRLQA